MEGIDVFHGIMLPIFWALLTMVVLFLFFLRKERKATKSVISGMRSFQGDGRVREGGDMRERLSRAAAELDFSDSRLPSGVLFVLSVSDSDSAIRISQGRLTTSSVLPGVFLFGRTQGDRYRAVHALACGPGDISLTFDRSRLWFVKGESLGDGSVVAKGVATAGIALAAVHGEGDVDLERCKALRVEADSRGNGEIRLESHGEAVVRMFSAGDVHVRGYARCRQKVANAGQGDYGFVPSYYAVDVARDTDHLARECPATDFDLLSFFDGIFAELASAKHSSDVVHFVHTEISPSSKLGVIRYFEGKCARLDVSERDGCVVLGLHRLTIDKPGWSLPMQEEVFAAYPGTKDVFLVEEHPFVKVAGA